MDQNNWRWCRKCQGLFFAGNGTLGVCPNKEGVGHDLTGSGDYHLLGGDQTYPGQGGWRWCRKCQGLCFAGNATPGACPNKESGGRCDHTGSGDYCLIVNFKDFPGQDNWRRCRKCQGLFFAGNGTSGICFNKEGGGGHDPAGSNNYILALNAPPPTSFSAGGFTTKLCPGGEWSTLEWTIHHPVGAAFVGPAGAEIEVGLLMAGIQRQVLDGISVKTLATDWGQIQVRPRKKSYITYRWYLTGQSGESPKIGIFPNNFIS